jgi:hypothetical protein
LSFKSKIKPYSNNSISKQQYHNLLPDYRKLRQLQDDLNKILEDKNVKPTSDIDDISPFQKKNISAQYSCVLSLNL